MAIYLTIIMHNVSTVFVPKANIIEGYHAECNDGPEVFSSGRCDLIFPGPG